jgi:hypothetical protein
MVTGFSLVLYSRLHLVLFRSTRLHLILCVIIINGLVVHTPNVVSLFISDSKLFHGVSMAEVVFSVQEVFLSSLYIWLYWRFMDQGSSPAQSGSESGSGNDAKGREKEGVRGGGLEGHRRRTLWLLIAAQIIILSCDIIMTTLLYLELFLARLAVMGFIYAVKLNIEFLVLNRLVSGDRTEDFAQSLRDEGIVDVAMPTTSALGKMPRNETYEFKAKRCTCQRTDSTVPMLGAMEHWSHDRANQVVTPGGDGEGDLGALRTGLLYRYGTEDEELGLERSSLDEIEKRYLGRYEV